ncbi:MULTISPECIES: acyltransferase [unclassified Pseudomonas]|uniref:acyltransferase family protein n=1 Tax=unclassified Pseudomonas TaxID=196821 RepID=UPI00073189F6|nr:MULTISPECIES: acyltransferase [unclassified Pseudomonas]KSW22626.1 acyltransferase [Pseudomonas sp. ADP]OBP11400.1 acyltransferase [Pseudomonas sp. EGD-AKN5]QOF85439.1 acyltransferase [Pseudomonas sp. ADPe]
MKDRIYCLDGIRGIAALWVLVGHTMILTGFALPIIVNADLGVDLFILLSGFLMVYQYQLRCGHEDWRRPVTWRAFWLRRLFRLSPLYYVVLIVGLSIGAMIYQDRVIIDLFVGNPPQRPERYLDPSALNFALHFSYLFGFLPDYAFRTPLPDWSIALEMQFYLAFPFLILIARRIGWIVFAIAAAAVAFVVERILTSHGIYFPMPTFLPLKLHMFSAGMLIAAARSEAQLHRFGHLLVALALAMVPVGGIADAMHISARAVLTLIFFALIHFQSVIVIGRSSRILGAKPFFWLGELSYGVYLVHLLVIHPVSASLIERFGGNWSKLGIFSATLLISLIVAYSVAWIGYSLIEKPGQALGRKIIKSIQSRKNAVQTAAEENSSS